MAAAQLQHLTEELKQINGQIETALSTAPSLVPSTNFHNSISNEEDDQFDPAYLEQLKKQTLQQRAAKLGDAFGGKKTLRRRRSRRNTLRRKKNKARVHVRR